MSNTQTILEIMENTIEALKNNKENVLGIIQNLQAEYKNKKLELENIKAQLPQLMNETHRLKVTDKKLRKELMLASHDFSEVGHEKIKALFEEASTVHAELFKAEEKEQSYIMRRNNLELALKQMKANIELAESMAQQLIASLSYLQEGLSHIHEAKTEDKKPKDVATASPLLTAIKCIEGEKTRIARDLHDGPTQRIASVQMRIDFCKTAITLDLEKGLSLLDHLKNDLAIALTEVRAILFDLTPAPLEKLGLKTCIEHLLYNFSDKLEVGINYSYQLEGLDIELSLQTAIYRTVQELITNVKKHAQAKNISLILHGTKEFIYVLFEDDGLGFTVPEDIESIPSQKKSYGLFNIHTRIKHLDGQLKIRSTPNKGSRFQIQLPLQLT